MSPTKEELDPDLMILDPCPEWAKQPGSQPRTLKELMEFTSQTNKPKAFVQKWLRDKGYPVEWCPPDLR